MLSEGMRDALTWAGLGFLIMSALTGIIWAVLAWDEHRMIRDALPPYLRDMLKKQRDP